MWSKLRLKENILLQKSRLRWDSEGDSNSRYLHSVMKERMGRNFIGSVTSKESLVDSADGVKEDVRSLFSKKFVEGHFNRPLLDGISLPTLSSIDSNDLCLPFTEEDIKDVVWSYDGSKSPGPDGFNFFFIRKCWLFM